MPDISLSEYLRECELRNPEFQKDRRELFRKYRDLDFNCPSKGMSPEEWLEQKRQFDSDWLRLFDRWPFISPDLGPSNAKWPDRPRIYLGFDAARDREGFITLRAHKSATGDDVKRFWQHLKRGSTEPTGRVRYHSGAWRDRLKIWDLFVEKRRTFSQVARQIRKPVSTVKSLFWAARLDILGVPQKAKRSRADRQAVMIAQMEPKDQRHFEECSECRKAKTPEDFCPPYRAYVTQDERSLRERLP